MSNRSWLERIAAAIAVTLAVTYIGAASIDVAAGFVAGAITAVIFGAVLLGQYLSRPK
ncbi:hypothetical protein [Mycobacterium arosiense]|uniref:hypothetical protein n=1 Tax=Mycobacterium arosiense TaxID=425468 RepID=UPI001301F56C|nr:hypothetical protein [Mycobacterium arosiense]